MYLPTFGGSGLLHLIAAHPRVVAIFGVAATIGALMAPQAPGRLLGTAGHIERLDSGIGKQFAAVAEERQAAAEEEAVRLLEQNDRKQIEAAVARLLRSCAAACTDISTDRVVSDHALLVRVLMLSELDQLAHPPHANVAGAASLTNRPTGAAN